MALGLGTQTSAQAQVAISDSGTPSYSLPIKVPPGIAGMTPQIGLTYTASNVDGPVGYGWTVQGISAITRCPTNRATDGINIGVQYSAADKLCLDGQRLIQTDWQGNPSSAQTNDSLGGTREYRTEKDTYARIRSYNSAGGVAANGPQFFKVWTKSGQIYEYGNDPAGNNAQNPDGSANAAISITVNGQPSGVISAWPVSRISDTKSNYIDFFYTQRDVAWGSSATPGHEWNLDHILYTGSLAQSQAPNNRISFIYADKADSGPNIGNIRAEAYHHGAKNVSISRLTNIVTYTNLAGGALQVRNYPLTYGLGTVSRRSRLAQVSECLDGDPTASPPTGPSHCLPATTFNYTNPDPNIADQVGNEVMVQSGGFGQFKNARLLDAAGGWGVLVGDFNGDGKADFLRWSSTANAQTNPIPNQLWTSNGDGNFTFQTAFNWATALFFSTDGCSYSMVMDADGDGRQDILRLTNATANDGSTCPGASGGSFAQFFLSNGDGTFAVKTVNGTNKLNVGGTPINLSRVISRPVYPSCGGGGGQPAGINQGGAGVGAGSGMGAGAGVATAGSSGAIAQSCTGTWYNGWTAGSTFYLLDVNGDGRMDLITTVLPAVAPQQGSMPRPDCASVQCTHVYLGNGDGSFTEDTASNLAHYTLYSAPGALNAYQWPSHLSDLDGDGLTDIVNVYSGASFQSQGNGNFTPVTTSQTCDRPLDYNGDGRIDCLTASTSGAASNVLSTSTGVGALPPVSNFNLTSVGEELASPDGVAVGSAYGSSIVDLNSDARSDILRWHDDATQNKLYLSNGDGTFHLSSLFASGDGSPGSVGMTTVQLKKSDASYDFIVADFTGHGDEEIMRLSATATTAGTDASQTNNLYVKQYSGQPDLLTSVTGPTGLTTHLSYAPLSNTTRYTSDSGVAGYAASYPLVDLTLPMYVVTTTAQDTGVGASTVQTDYFYKGLKSTWSGRGFQGFREVRRQSPAPNGAALTVVTDYLQTYPYTGVAYHTETRQGTLTDDTAPVLSTVDSVYCDTTSATDPATATYKGPCATSAPVQRPYLYKTVENATDLDGSVFPKVTTTNTFDNYGDPLTISVSQYGTSPADGTARNFVKTTTNIYCTDTTFTTYPGCTTTFISDSLWLPGRLVWATQHNTVPNAIGSITTSPGTAPHASDITGTPP